MASGFRLWRGGGLPHFSHQRILTAQENCLVSRQQLSTRVPSSPHNRVGTRSIPTPRRMAPSRCSGWGPQTRYNAFGNPRTPALPYPPRRQTHCTPTRWRPTSDTPDPFSSILLGKKEPGRPHAHFFLVSRSAAGFRWADDPSENTLDPCTGLAIRRFLREVGAGGLSFLSMRAGPLWLPRGPPIRRDSER